MTFLSNPKIISKTPVLTTILLEGANVFQLIEMWTNKTSAGQSVWGWVLVNLALILWLNFYRVCTPDQKWAIWATAVGIVINFGVILTALALQ